MTKTEKQFLLDALKIIELRLYDMKQINALNLSRKCIEIIKKEQPTEVTH